MTFHVADDILGKLTRQIGDLLRRLTGGSADPDRARFGLRIAAEKPPAEPKQANLTRGMYLLESRWSYDAFHHELATFTIEKCDYPYGFEDFFNTEITNDQKRDMLIALRRIYNAQVPTHGGHKMLRLYQVLDYTWFGCSEGMGVDGTVERSDVMLHYNLKPLMDFADDCTPIPIKVTVQKSLEEEFIQILRSMHEAGEGVKITLKPSFDAKPAGAILNTYGISFNFSTDTRAKLIARSAVESEKLQSITITLRHRGGHIQGIRQIATILAPHLEKVEVVDKRDNSDGFLI